MLQLLPQSETLYPNIQNPKEAVDFINAYIEKYHCENMSVDLSFMNIVDACFVSTICSTSHYIKYPNGRINWIVSSKLVQEFNKTLNLGNANYIS